MGIFGIGWLSKKPRSNRDGTGERGSGAKRPSQLPTPREHDRSVPETLVCRGDAATGALRRGEHWHLESRPPKGGAGHCCTLEGIAIVTAALLCEEASSFAALARDEEGVFLSALGSREKRLAALVAFRARSAARRRDSMDPKLVPDWAHSRLAISSGSLGAELLTLPRNVEAAVDGVLLGARSGEGPGFGEWFSPSLHFALPRDSD